jgi:alcohol dehydrogenase
MRALVFDGQLQLQAISTPALTPGEALIRPRLVGICATDLQLTRGYKGFPQKGPGVLGHEFVGMVVDCADQLWVGRRVVGEINASCRQCATCLRGDAPHCPQRTTLGINGRDGTLADYFALPIANLHEVPAALPDTAAVFAEPLAAALEILEQTHLRPTDRVVVVGDGKLGLLVAQVLRLPGCDVTVVGRHPERWTLLQRQQIVATAAPDELAERSYDLVVDCTGQPHGLELARRLTRPRGRLVMKSTFHGQVSLDLAPFVVDELQIIGSRCGPFDAALRLLERGLVETAPLITAEYPFAEAEQAFAAAPGALKILVRFE